MADTTVVEKFLDAIKSATIPSCDVWSTEAKLDATVPNWRLHAVGPDAIRAEYARWFADPGHFDELRRHRVDDGSAEVVEYTLSWSENGVPHAAHHMHLLQLPSRRLDVAGLWLPARRPAGAVGARHPGPPAPCFNQPIVGAAPVALSAPAAPSTHPARPSDHVKPLAGTDLCEAPHFQYHVQGTLHIVMADGSEFDVRPGDVTAAARSRRLGGG